MEKTQLQKSHATVPLRTTKVLRQIGCSAGHFRRNFASPAPSPDQDKTIELRSIDHLLFFKN